MLPSTDRQSLGVITHGSLEGGLQMKLGRAESVEDVTSGSLVVVAGTQYDFFAMVKDVRIEAANEQILLNPPPAESDLLRKVMRGTGTYATLDLQPMLMAPQGGDAEHEEPQSVKTIPSHFSAVSLASEDDVARIFGAEANLGEDGQPRYFHIGSPREMEDIPVCLDLKKFVERSNAVFGKTGTGKSFLTRILLSGLIQSGRAVNLVFDMHGEYGMGTTKEADAAGGETFVPGLKKLFRSKVSIFSLDPTATRERTGQSPDVPVYLYADQVTPADILPLQETMNLNDTAADSCYALQRRHGDAWLLELLDTEEGKMDALAESVGAHTGSMKALRRKFGKLRQADFFRAASSESRRDVTAQLMECIADGKSVVFEFGQYKDISTYLLVANIITRQIRAQYEEQANTFARTQNAADKPQQLMITIEEAHKFLTPQIAGETSFGKIAREMRKYFVSLLVVDQRPSAIDDEVLSQIGTKIVAQLSDDKDLAAALVGTRDSAALRKVLASLDSKQQALLMGHAPPMPIAIETRTYDQNFFEAVQPGGPSSPVGGGDGQVKKTETGERMDWY
jgi:DNA helicase HerA-like ATPase